MYAERARYLCVLYIHIHTLYTHRDRISPLNSNNNNCDTPQNNRSWTTKKYERIGYVRDSNDDVTSTKAYFELFAIRCWIGFVCWMFVPKLTQPHIHTIFTRTLNQIQCSSYLVFLPLYWSCSVLPSLPFVAIHWFWDTAFSLVHSIISQYFSFGVQLCQCCCVANALKTGNSEKMWLTWNTRNDNFSVKCKEKKLKMNLSMKKLQFNFFNFKNAFTCRSKIFRHFLIRPDFLWTIILNRLPKPVE